jgi:hypothetical protein
MQGGFTADDYGIGPMRDAFHKDRGAACRPLTARRLSANTSEGCSPAIGSYNNPPLIDRSLLPSDVLVNQGELYPWHGWTEKSR